MGKVKKNKNRIGSVLKDQIANVTNYLKREQSKTEPDQKKLNNYKSRIQYAQRTLDRLGKPRIGLGISTDSSTSFRFPTQQNKVR
tara:strand:- start:4 stop:258 length:255 start_codon:yes stop_codon:yes gene_type:complete